MEFNFIMKLMDQNLNFYHGIEELNTTQVP
jgi:hypothetical protein